METACLIGPDPPSPDHVSCMAEPALKPSDPIRPVLLPQDIWSHASITGTYIFTQKFSRIDIGSSIWPYAFWQNKTGAERKLIFPYSTTWSTLGDGRPNIFQDILRGILIALFPVGSDQSWSCQVIAKTGKKNPKNSRKRRRLFISILIILMHACMHAAFN